MSEIHFTRREGGKAESAPPRTPTPPEQTPEPPPPPPRPPRHFSPHIIIASVAVLQTLAVWATMGGIGMSWDEAYYFEPNRSAVNWLVDSFLGAIGPGGHDAYWEEIWELPAVPRFVHGISGALFDGTWIAGDGAFAPLIAQRLLNGVAHGINTWLIALLLLPVTGLVPALGAMLAHGTMPRVFGHAHFAATETLMVTMTLLVALAFLRGLRSGWAAALTGVLFGLALSTKFNLLLLPVPLWLWAWWHHRQRCASNLVAMAFLAPVVWVLTWPWLWSDTAPKILAYLEHFLVHQQTAVWFHGQRWGYGDVSAPWFYPLEMIAVTVPIPTLILAAIGGLCCLSRGEHDGRERLFLLLALVPLMASSLPGAPRYDGVRLFFPVFAPMALMVGVALGRMRGLKHYIRPERRERASLRVGAVAAALGLAALPGAVGIARVHPYELSHFNFLVGGIRGAQERGYEMTAWCEAVNEDVVEHLNTALPQSAGLRSLAFHTRILEHLREWGSLRSDIRLGAPLAEADYHLIQARRGFFGIEEVLLFDQWIPRSSRRFGWPRGRPVPDVALVVVAETGDAFRTVIARHPAIAAPAEDTL